MEQQVAEKLLVLADKLGVAVDVLWQALLRQARIEGIYDSCIVVCLLIFLVVWVFVVKGTVQMMKKLPKLELNINEGIITTGVARAVVVGAISTVLFFIVLDRLIALPNILAGLFNPEYWALHKLLSK